MKIKIILLRILLGENNSNTNLNADVNDTITIDEQGTSEEQIDKEYSISKRNECTELGKMKREIYNNVVEVQYYEGTAQCVIQYLNPEWVEGALAGNEVYGCRMYEQGENCEIKKYLTEVY